MPQTLEDEILIACSRLHLEEVHRDRVTSACLRGAIDWELVYSAAVAHNIAPLVYKNLQDCKTANDSISRKVADKFQNVFRFYALKNAIAREEIAEMAAFFDSRSHDVLLLKHVALSVRLRNLFDVTMSDDVDVVVRPKGESVDRLDERYLCKIRPWMVADGLQEAFRWFTYDDLDHTSAVIREFWALHDHCRRLFLELDNRFHHDIVWGGSIDFRKVWEDANRDQVEGRDVYVPDDHDLIIMSSINIHRKPYVRLRNLVEIHELVRHGEDMDWEAFMRKARDYQCNSLVYSALHATRTVLESNLPGSVLKALRPGVVRGRAIAYINHKISPSAICLSRNPGSQPRGLREVARRSLALNGRQLMRFIWLRIILHRIFGVLKW
jgi:hypothetical protein